MKKEYLTSLSALTIYWTLITVVAMAPYLFFGQLIAPGADAIGYFYPAYYWYSEALKSGMSFLWNPSIYSGFPMYISQVGGFFEPLNIVLFSTIPSFAIAYHLRLTLDYVLVMLFSYLVGRRWGISKLAAFFIGPMYLLSMHWWYISTIHFSNSLFVLPFLFFAYMRARDALSIYHRFGWAIVGGIGLGWAFLGGYAQFIVYSLTFLGIFAVGDFFWNIDRSKRTLRYGAELVGVLGIVALVGAIVGIPQILPSILYVPFSVRGGGVAYDLSQFKVLGWKEFIFFIFPDYLRFPLLTGGKKSLFVGAFYLLLAIITVVHFKKNRLVPIFTGLFSFAFILALPGSYFYYFLHKLPVFELFRFPSRWLFNGIWVVAVLGAMGFDLLRENADRKTRYVVIASGVVVGAFTLLVVACSLFGEWFWGPIKDLGFWLFSHGAYSPNMFPKGLEHYKGALDRGVDAWRTVASITNIPFMIPFTSLVTSWAIVALRAYGLVTVRWYQIAGAIVLGATFLGIFVARWPDTISSKFIDENRVTTEKFIPAEDLKLYRVHPFSPGYQFQPRHSSLTWNTEDTIAAIELQHGILTPNGNQYSGVLLTDGYEPFISRDLLHVLAVRLGSNYTSQDELTGVTFEDRKKLVMEHLDIVGMMGGKYIITGTHFDHPDLEFLGTHYGSWYETPFYMYKYDKALPRVYLAENTQSVPHETMRELIESGKKFLVATYIDCTDCANDHVAPGGKLTINAMENGYFDLTVNAKDPQWLIISEQLLPGWILAIDGNRVEPIRANGVYMAIRVPGGEHRILAQYEGIAGEAKWLRPLGLFPYPLISQ